MEKLKLSRIKNKPEHVLSYKCPNCDKPMYANIVLCQPYQWWSCDKCKKTFELSFKELEQKN